MVRRFFLFALALWGGLPLPARAIAQLGIPGHGQITPIPAPAPPAADRTISPGRSIGKITLGDRRQTVHKVLRRPGGSYRFGRKAPRLRGDYWASATANSAGHTLRVVYENDRVVQVSVTSPAFKTPDGISTGGGPAAVRSAYGPLRERRYFVRGSGGGLINHLDNTARGIAFVFTAPASLEDQPYRFYAIAVHRPGRAVLPEPDEEPITSGRTSSGVLAPERSVP